MDKCCSQPKKLVIINILDILKRYSDENHRLSQKEILGILEKEYDMKLDRKAINRNLDNLIESGYKIEFTSKARYHKDGSSTVARDGWYLERDFTDAELRLLIDSLLFSKHIPYNQCKDLINKIKDLSNDYFNAKVKHISNLPEKFPKNKQLFYTIEILDEAISRHKKVEFSYSDFGTDKKRHPRKDTNGKAKRYIVNPYQIVATNGRYYLICNNENHSDICNMRLDRICDIKMLQLPVKEKFLIKGMENGLDLPKHMAEHIYMFGGESARVTFNAKRKILNDIFDWFGTDVTFMEDNIEEVKVCVNVNLDAMQYWAMQYGLFVEILEPIELRERLKNAVSIMAEKYD